MESESEPSDPFDSRLYNSTSEELSSLDLVNMSSDTFPITSEIPLSSMEDSRDTLLNSSPDFPISLLGVEPSILSDSTLESSLAHPLSWSESQSDGVKDATLSELSELPLSDMPLSDMVDYDSDCSFQEEPSQEPNPEVGAQYRKGINTLDRGFFQSTKFDILNAMKAEVCKVASVNASETTDTESQNVTLKIGNEEIKDNISENTKAIEETKAKVTEEMGTEASNVTENQGSEDFELKVTEDKEINAIKDTEDQETKASEDTEDQETKASEGTGDKETKASDNIENTASEGKEIKVNGVIEVPCAKTCNGIEKDVHSSARCDILDAIESIVKDTTNSIALVNTQDKSLDAINHCLKENLGEESGKSLDAVQDIFKETSNDTSCADTKVSVLCAQETNIKEELIKENGKSVMGSEIVEHKVAEHIEMEVSIVSKDKVSEVIETKDSVGQDMETEVSKAVEGKVGLDMGTEVSKAVEGKVGLDMETEVGKAVEGKVGLDMETEVSKAVEGKVGLDMETEVSKAVEGKVGLDMETEVGKAVEGKVGLDMETEVGKAVEGKVGLDMETEVGKAVEGKVGLDMETEVSKAVEGKVGLDMGTEVSKAVEGKVGLDMETEVSKAVDGKVGLDMETEVGKAVEGKVGLDMETEVSKAVEEKVGLDMETEVSKAVEGKGGLDMETEVSKAVEGKVGLDMETEVSEAVEDNDSKDKETELSSAIEDEVDKNMETKLSDAVKDNGSKNIDSVVNEAVEENLSKNSEMEEVEAKIKEADKEKIVEVENSSGVTGEASAVSEASSSGVLESSTDTIPGTSKSTEVTASKRPIEEEDQIEFECNDDGQAETDSILLEEELRLDQLNLPSQVSPEPDAPVGEGEREVQYKKLVELLSKSKFYTDVLLRKVEADIDKYSRKRKQYEAATNGSPSKKMKILMENQRAMYQIASEVMKNKQEKTTSVDESADQSQSLSQSTAERKPAGRIKQPKYLIGGTLRDYQLEGFHWLRVLYENGVNGILADEMGLGKTIQVIALLSHLVQMKIKGPFLIVGPLSTLPNWMIEFKRFAPQLHVVLFYGTKAERKRMSENLLRRKTVDGTLCYPIVVTSYEIPVFERAFMSRLKWKYIIVDEGHKIKNYNTLLAKVLRSFDSANRLLLTGTPLQNSLSELWSLLNFLVPEIFENLDVFESWFRIEEIADDAGRQKIIEEERRKNVLKTLHQILAPFMLRRVKSEVTLDIPKKREVIVKTPMTEMQYKLYEALLNKNVGYLKKIQVEDVIIPDVNGKRPRRSCTIGKSYEEKSEPDDLKSSMNSGKKNDIESIITHFIRVKMQKPWVALKQIANHPYLIHYPLQEDGKTFLVDEGVVKSSGKFLVLDAMLEKLHAKGHKVLIFSTLCMLLDVLEDYLSLRNYLYERLDGNVKIADRADAIQRFNSDPNIFLFLLSTRAGGLGVNLTGADTVIFLDSDWNPQADLQAQDRCHRIGQTKPVMVYRLVTTGSIDEQILQRASAKRVLEKMVICKGTSVQKEFDLDELKSILESRDHSDTVYTDGQVLTDEQLEKLLDRSDLLN